MVRFTSSGDTLIDEVRALWVFGKNSSGPTRENGVRDEASCVLPPAATP